MTDRQTHRRTDRINRQAGRQADWTQSRTRVGGGDLSSSAPARGLRYDDGAGVNLAWKATAVLEEQHMDLALEMGISFPISPSSVPTVLGRVRNLLAELSGA